MDGNWQEENEKLLMISKNFAKSLKGNKLERKEVWYVFKTSFMKKLEYPMPVTSLALEDWDEIIKPVLGPLCNKLGIVRTWNVKLLFAPSKFHGLDIKHLYLWQHLTQLETLVGKYYQKTPYSSYC